MAVKFCFASGCSPTQVTCAGEQASFLVTHEEDLEGAKCTPVRLGDLGPLSYKTYALNVLRGLWAAAMGMPDDTKDIWRNRIICILAPIKDVFYISFIPSNPYKPQALQVMRMNDLNESASSQKVYCCNFLNCKFILPKEQPDYVFDLSQWDFSQFEAEPLTLALQYLKNEKTLKGMALTLRDEHGQLSTYVWIKL